MRKGSRAIVVNDVAYRWRANGNDGSIDVTIWPDNQPGPAIETRFHYGETVSPLGPGHWISNGDQVVITNRIIKRVIGYAVESHGYDPTTQAPAVGLRWIEDFIEMDDVIRATDTKQP